MASLRACQPQSVEAGAGGSTEQSSRQVPVVAARLGAGVHTHFFHVFLWVSVPRLGQPYVGWVCLGPHAPSVSSVDVGRPAPWGWRQSRVLSTGPGAGRGGPSAPRMGWGHCAHQQSPSEVIRSGKAS